VTVGPTVALKVTFIFPVTHNCPRVPGSAGKVTTGEPEAALNIARSALPGTEAPEAPPDVADQFVVLFQAPVPPVTQYRVAANVLRAKALKTTKNRKYFKILLQLTFLFSFFLTETVSVSVTETRVV
jgi:hypothetical protein